MTTKIILPVQLNPISRRADKSVKLSFITRELTPEEILTAMSLEGSEMWLCLAPEQSEANVPENMGAVEIGQKTAGQRMRSVMFILYKQDTENQKYVGTFDNYYNEKMEKLIQLLKDKIED